MSTPPKDFEQLNESLEELLSSDTLDNLTFNELAALRVVITNLRKKVDCAWTKKTGDYVTFLGQTANSR